MRVSAQNWAFVAFALQMTGYVYDVCHGSSHPQGPLFLHQRPSSQFSNLPEEVSLQMMRYLDDKKPFGATNRRNRKLVRQLELGLCHFVLTSPVCWECEPNHQLADSTNKRAVLRSLYAQSHLGGYSTVSFTQ